MIYVLITFGIKPEHRDAFVAAVGECVATSRKDKGCISHDCVASLTNPNQFMFIERWESDEAFAAHRKAAYVVAWKEFIAPMMMGPQAIEIITPADVKR